MVSFFGELKRFGQPFWNRLPNRLTQSGTAKSVERMCRQALSGIRCAALRRRLFTVCSPLSVVIPVAKRSCRSGIVQQGPFAGMRFSMERTFTPPLPALLGTYERELWPHICDASRYCDGYIVVGAAEGYYAIGFSRLPGASDVVAFEMDGTARDILRRNIDLNGAAERISILGSCDSRLLESSLRRFARPLVLIDIEGGEADLIEGVNPELMRAATLLVEVHDFVDRSLGDRMRAHLLETHKVQEVWQEDRRPDDLPPSLPLKRFLKPWYTKALNEGRPSRMRWLIFKPSKLAQTV